MTDKYFCKTYKDGENIFSEGERAGVAYLIDTGQVRLHKTTNGQAQEIDTISPGKIFGEMGVLSDSNRMASATAVGETKLTGCHRLELIQHVDKLDADKRDALQFLIIYCQEFLPYELMDSRPNNEETRHLDNLALQLVRKANMPGHMDNLDPFLQGLYKVLISYTERRLPPNLKD